MKKRVRIYKSPTGEGQFINKTAQFLRKARMGGTPSVEELSYPGAGQGQAQPANDDQLASLVMQDISNSRPKEEIVVKLVNMYGKDPMEATNFVDQMYTYLEQQSEDAKEEDSEDTSDEEVTSGDPEDAEEETVMAPVQEIEEGFYGDDQNNDMANEIANEDDEVEDDDTDVASQMVMMHGGFMRAQDGAEVENEYPIVFPGVEAYLPANMSDMMGGSYDVATGEAWQRPDFRSPETSQDSGLSYSSMDPGASAMMEGDAEAVAEEGVAPEENYDESEFRKGGAYKKGKSAYVNSVLKLVKKQMGGDQASNDPNNLVKKADQADPTGNNVRRGILDNYIGTLKNQSQMAVAKEEAEQAYDQMMQQQQQMNQSGMYGTPMAQNGMQTNTRHYANQPRTGLFNREPREVRAPRVPQGFGYGYPPIESMDVRRSGIFGRPKEYSVNFGQMPSAMPGSVPTNYGRTTVKKSPARRIVEDQAIYINSQSNKDVAKVTPGNEATNKDTKVTEKIQIKEEGGPVQNPFSDEYGNLQRFVYGGDDDPSLAPIDQSDIDYSDSVDTTDPYFQRGGVFNTLFPANVSSGYRTQYLGAHNAAGQQVPGVLGQNAKIKSINVTKTGLLGRPKKYSVTFSQDALNNAKKDNTSLTAEGTQGSKTVAPVNAQNTLSQREIDRGERQAGRQRPWHAGRRYENSFEEYELTPEEQKRYAANDARYEADLAAAKKLRMDEESILRKMSSPKSESGISQDQIQDFQQMFGNVSGVPSYAESPYAIKGTRSQNEFSQGNPQTSLQYRNGGDLKRFIPTAQTGVNTPVSYADNPAMQGNLVSFEPGIQGLQGGFDWTSITGPGTVTQENADGTETYGVDASYKGPQYDPAVNLDKPQEDITYDFKTKRNMSNAAVQGSLLAGNAAARGALGMVDRFQNKKNQKERYQNLTADNIYGADTSRDRGDYDSNSGLYRPDEMGQTWNSRSKQMGGQNDYLNEDPDYVEGDELDMTDEEIQDYLAKGGEIEYL